MRQKKQWHTDAVPKVKPLSKVAFFRFTFISVFTLWVRMIMIWEDSTAVYNMCESCMKVDTVVHEIGAISYAVIFLALSIPKNSGLCDVLFICSSGFCKENCMWNKDTNGVIWQWKMQHEASKGFHISPFVFCFNRSIPFRKCQKNKDATLPKRDVVKKLPLQLCVLGNPIYNYHYPPIKD